MARKDSLTHNHYIAPALRRKNRLLRETTASHTQSISKAMDIAWPTFAAAPHGQFSKNTEIMDVEQALIYRLAHKRFDMNRVDARCRTGDYGTPDREHGRRFRIERGMAAWFSACGSTRHLYAGPSGTGGQGLWPRGKFHCHPCRPYASGLRCYSGSYCQSLQRASR